MVFSGFAGNIAVICSSIYFLVILGIEFYGFIDFYLDVDIVTDRRIVDITQGGLFKRSIAELHLREVQDVHAKVHGFFPTMLNYGDVVIQTAGERANFIFSSVPDPYSVAKRIIDLHEHQIQIIDGSEDGTNCDHLTEKRGEGKFNFRAGSESEHLVRTTLSESNNVLHVGHKNLNQLRNGESNSGELSAGKEVNL
ncbi:MAG: PH domain-containing protein [Patescibacteria group bacterium]